jgi:hypothetical protein
MIPRILAACPSLERYRTLSHNTLEELGLPRRQLRVNPVVLTAYPSLPVCPTNGHRRTGAICLKRANSRHTHRRIEVSFADRGLPFTP